MDVKTLADRLGFRGKMLEMSGLVNPAELLEEACLAGYLPAVQMLLERYSKNEGSGKTQPSLQRAFRKGVESGSEAVVRLFLDLKVRLDAPDDVEKTALHDAAELGHYHVAKLLLDVGADADAIDKNGHVPIDLALKENHESIVRLLIGHNGGILTSFDATTRLLSRKKRRHSDEKYRTGFNATVVHFYDKPGTGDAHRVERLPVEELVWNEAESFDNIFEGKTETEYIPRRSTSDYIWTRCKTEYYPKAEFRWIHLPANCVCVALTLCHNKCKMLICPDELGRGDQLQLAQLRVSWLTMSHRTL